MNLFRLFAEGQIRYNGLIAGSRNVVKRAVILSLFERKSVGAGVVWLITLLPVMCVLPCNAQDSFSDDSHWDPRFGPPAVFLNPYNIESTEDYVLVSGQLYKQDDLWTYGTVYRSAHGHEMQELDISGWEDATIMAGAARIFARRGPGNEEIGELDLDAGTAYLIPNPPGSSHKFTTFGDTLFAITTAGGEVFRWKGEAWEMRGPPLGLVVDDWVVAETGVFAVVGPGTICDPDDCNTALWHLDGSSWTQIGLAKGTGNPPVSGLAVDSRGRFVIAGDFVSVNNTPAQRAARWDGVDWSALGEGIPPEMDFITHLVALDTTIYAATTGNLVLEWEGTAWDTLGGRPSDFVRKLEVAEDRLYASGWFTAIGDTAAYRVAEWDAEDNRWLPVFPVMGDGIDGDVRALTIGPAGSVFAGGVFAAAGAVDARNVARWDSTRWWSVGEGIADPVDALAAGTSQLFAGTHNGVAVTDLEDPSWSYLPGLADGRNLTYVNDVLVMGDTLYVTARAGSFPAHMRGVFAWAGGTWETLGEFWAHEEAGAVYGLAIDDQSMLYAAGDFTRVGSVQARNIARWDGEAWHALGDGLEHRAEAVEAGGGGVYAGGVDSELWIWDHPNQQWSSTLLPGENHGCARLVRALLWRPDGIFVGSVPVCPTTKIGNLNQDAVLLARWSEGSWQVPGSGIGSGAVNALAASGDDLYVGGHFWEAGATPASHFARWNPTVRLPIVSPEPRTRTKLEQNFPNPAKSTTTIRFSVERTSAYVRLKVLDLLGRQVAVLHDGPLRAGAHEVVFDAGGLAGGVYLYRLSIDGRSFSRKMLLVR